jgi:capsular polysaccharide transport system ATP-binding protein
MIELSHVTKSYRTRSGSIQVLHDVNFRLERGQKAGVLGRNGSGKSTFVRIVGGAEAPTTGRVRREMKVSWPIAFAGGVQGSLSGLDNLKFICRIYGADYQGLLPFVEEFTELGRFLREPVKNYSSGMKARLNFALSMAIEFDCYLIDEVMAVGDKIFQQRCRRELIEKRADSSMILVSHVPNQIRKLCNLFFVLDKGRMYRFENVDDAYEFYNRDSGKPGWAAKG